MLQIGVVQRRDVSIIYSVILYSSHNLITKDTSCYNKSISSLELGAGQLTQLRYLNRPERKGPRSPRREPGNVSTTRI